MGGYLTGHPGTAFLGQSNELDLNCCTDVTDVHAALVQVGERQYHGQAVAFGVAGDWPRSRPSLEVFDERGERLHAQLSEGLIHVDLEATSLSS